MIVARSELTPAPAEIDRLNRPTTALTVFWATVRKDLRIERRYLPDLIGKGVELSIRMLFYLMLAGIISVKAGSSPIGQEMTDRDLFLFFQGGLLLFVFSGVALNTPVQAVSRDLYNGTLEYLYTNPISRYAYFVGTVVANAIVAQIIFLPLFLVLVISSQASALNLLMVLLVCLLTLVTLIAMGVMLALLAILWRQVGAVTAVVGILFEMLAGAYFPVSAFPSVLQYLAYLLPYTWGYDLIRYYSFSGRWQTLLPVWAEWSALVAYAIVFTILSRWLLARAEQRAKRTGLHLI